MMILVAATLLAAGSLAAARGDSRNTPSSGPIIINPKPNTPSPIGPRFRPTRGEFSNPENFRLALEAYRERLEAWQLSADENVTIKYKEELKGYRSGIEVYRRAVEQSKGQ